MHSKYFMDKHKLINTEKMISYIKRKLQISNHTFKQMIKLDIQMDRNKAS